MMVGDVLGIIRILSTNLWLGTGLAIELMVSWTLVSLMRFDVGFREQQI